MKENGSAYTLDSHNPFLDHENIEEVKGKVYSKALQAFPLLPDVLKKSAIGPRSSFVRKNAVHPLIYAVGGDDGHNDRNPFNSVMYLDQQTGSWKYAAPLHQKRSVCGVASINSHLYVVGGYNGERAVDSVERFDAATGTWTNVASISRRRCSCG